VKSLKLVFIILSYEAHKTYCKVLSRMCDIRHAKVSAKELIKTAKCGQGLRPQRVNRILKNAETVLSACSDMLDQPVRSCYQHQQLLGVMKRKGKNKK
jgi:hypothetical protein